MKKILLSLGMIVFVGAAVAGATGAFFTDTETSTGNVFTAGSLDLRVDSECHYYQNGDDVGCGDWGNWEEADLLEGVHKFFHFLDLKPGDWGEDTISLHVYDNDAWGRIIFDMTENNDNGCTEPESDEDVTCGNPGEDEGELLLAMGPHFKMWLDQGATPGFQNVKPDQNTPGEYVDTNEDLTEGDNVWQTGEPEVNLYENLDLHYVLYNAYLSGQCGDVQTPSDGHNSYGHCHGLAFDGRLVGSTTYYLGFEWALPIGTTNVVQTDSLGGNIGFEVEQHRNNPNPWN